MGELDLENLVNFYVETAFEIAKKSVSLDEFDRYVREDISKKLNVSVKTIGWIHHPFHWAFFLEDNGSPFELQEDFIVGLNKKRYSKSKMINYILTNYRSLLEEKIKINL